VKAAVRALCESVASEFMSSGFRAVVAGLWPGTVGVCDLWPIPMTHFGFGHQKQSLSSVLKQNRQLVLRAQEVPLTRHRLCIQPS